MFKNIYKLLSVSVLFVFICLLSNKVFGHPPVYFTPSSDVPQFNEHYRHKEGYICSEGERPQHCHSKVKTKGVLERHLNGHTLDKLIGSIDAIPAGKGIKTSMVVASTMFIKIPTKVIVRHRMDTAFNKLYLKDKDKIMKDRAGEYNGLIERLRNSTSIKDLTNLVTPNNVLPAGFIKLNKGKIRMVVTRTDSEGKTTWDIKAIWFKTNDEESNRLIKKLAEKHK